MERLTHYQKNGEVAEPYNRSQANEFAKKLAEYEDLEEQGLLVRLPCKVGDTVYYPCGKEVYEKKIVCFIHYGYTIAAFFNANLTESCEICNFGKNVFLTREEAETAALGKMQQSK